MLILCSFSVGLWLALEYVVGDVCGHGCSWCFGYPQDDYVGGVPFFYLHLRAAQCVLKYCKNKILLEEAMQELVFFGHLCE